MAGDLAAGAHHRPRLWANRNGEAVMAKVSAPNVYCVFAEFGPQCWRRPKPLRNHSVLADAIREANEKAASSRYDVEWVVSTHRDGPCLYRVAADERLRLTDAEREVIEWAVRAMRPECREVLQGLLDRTASPCTDCAWQPTKEFDDGTQAQAGGRNEDP